MSCPKRKVRENDLLGQGSASRERATEASRNDQPVSPSVGETRSEVMSVTSSSSEGKRDTASKAKSSEVKVSCPSFPSTPPAFDDLPATVSGVLLEQKVID